MRRNHKVVVFIVIACLLFSVNTYAIPEDVKGTSYEEAVDLLTEIGILKGYEDGLFNPDKNISRAEFAVIIARLLGIDIAYEVELGELSVSDMSEGEDNPYSEKNDNPYSEKSDDSYTENNDNPYSEISEGNTESNTESIETLEEGALFKDLSKDHWAEKSIRAVYDMGIIKGYNNGTFKPDEPVTYEQAVKMLVSSIGYDLYANQRGGYPVGYLVVASEKGITKKAEGVLGTYATRAIISQLVYNALDTDLMSQTGFGTDVTYTIQKGKSLLTEKLRLNKREGLVTGFSETSINDIYSKFNEDEIEIDRIKYKLSMDTRIDASDLIGRKVEFYFKEENDKEEIIYIKKDIDETSEVIIKADELRTTDSDYTSLNIVVDNEKDEKDEYKVAESARIIYNGKLIGTANYIDINLLKPLSGNLVLIDNHNDDLYDVVFVNSYRNFVVDRVSTGNKLITFKYDNKFNNKNSIELDPDDKDYVFKIIMDGKEVKIDELKEWDVVSIAESSNTVGKKIINVIVSRNKIEGQIEEIADSGEEIEILVSGENYKITENYIEAINNLNTDAKELALNLKGSFYLNIEGKISGVNVDKSESRSFGYLKAVGSSGGLDSIVEFRIFTENGEFKNYKLAEKVIYHDQDYINSNNYKMTAKDVLEKFVDSNGSVINQLIMFKVNINEEIEEVYKSITNNSSPGSLDYDFTRDYYIGIRGEATRFYAGLLAYRYRFNKDSVIFHIPDDKEYEEGYRIEKPSSLGFDKYFENISIYSVDKYFRIGTALVDGGATEIDRNPEAVVFDKLTRSINSDGENKSKVYFYESGRLTSKMVENEEVKSLKDNWYKDTKLVDLRKGDVFQYVSNSQNEITNIRILFRQSAPGTYRQQGNDGSFEYAPANKLQMMGFWVVYGKVVRMNGEMLIVNTWDDGTDPANETSQLLNSNTKYYKYDTAEDKVTVASIADIVEGDSVLIRKRYTPVMEVIIIK